MRAARAPAAALALAAAAAGAEPPPEPGEPWNTVSTRPIIVRTRAHPGTQVKEVWATGLLAAPPEFVQDTLLDGESFPRFMPYVKEVRNLPVPTKDGSWFAYQRVVPPLVAARDSVFHVWLEESLAPDGSGVFRNRWEAVPGMVPSVPGVVRTLLSTGSWEVRPGKAGGSRVSYRFLVDPGGNIPSWVADMGNRTGLAEVFIALETEAQRRSREPRRATATAALKPPPPPDVSKSAAAATAGDAGPGAAAAATTGGRDAGAGPGPKVTAQGDREPARLREPPRERTTKQRERKKRARATPASP
ncbi:MAG TPA: SRPBCC family protein [Myxococcales bacterium]|nr:SRPBCC family protein [Myxococcales bacterium]